MAFSTQGDSSSRSRRRFHSTTALSEINVTPFVDILLVMLIIFMLTAHVMEFGIEVDVPEVRITRDSAKELPVVSITRDGNLFLNEKIVNINDLAGTIQKRFGKRPAVSVRADKQTPWNPIAQVIAELGEAKIAVNMVTKPEETNRKGSRP